MGITTDLVQQLNRTFVSQRAEKDFYRKKKEEYKTYLYNYFYNKFSKNEDKQPDNIYSYFLQVDVQTKILNKFNELDISTKFDLYNNILKKIYTQFKNNYKMNYSYENAEKQEIQLMKEYLKLEEKHQKILKEKQKQEERYQQLLNEKQRIKQKGCFKILAGLFIGGKIANKTYKRIKY